MVKASQHLKCFFLFDVVSYLKNKFSLKFISIRFYIRVCESPIQTHTHLLTYPINCRKQNSTWRKKISKAQLCFNYDYHFSFACYGGMSVWDSMIIHSWSEVSTDGPGLLKVRAFWSSRPHTGICRCILQRMIGVLNSTAFIKVFLR